MKSLREIKERGYLPPKTLRIFLIVGSFILIKMLISNLRVIKKLHNTKNFNKQYVRPKRRYLLPQYKDRMKSCSSNEKFLRSTLYCNSNSELVIALANELGAYSKSDEEFVETVFNFVKRKITLEMLPLDSVDNTIIRGTGTCLHKISVFVALCRAAGIKARYKLYSLTVIQEWTDTFNSDPMVKKFSDAIGNFLIHGEGEAFIDGKWVICDVGPTPERQAATNLPITQFNEDVIENYLSAIPDSIMEVESLSYGLNILMRLINKLAPKTIDNVNIEVQDQINRGKKLLEKVGEENYNIQIKKKFRLKSPSINLEKNKSIIFDR